MLTKLSQRSILQTIMALSTIAVVLIATLLILMRPGKALAAGSVTVYPAPSGANLSTAYNMTVNGTSNPVYFTGTHNAHYAYFDFSGGPVQVQVTALTSGYWNNSVVIRPDAKGITASISGNTITFTISQPGQYSVERPDLDYTNADTQALIIAANPPQTNVPSPNDPNVLYYGPGLYNINSNITLTSGKTLYVAGGAVLNMTAQINASNTNTTAIRGRGIINFNTQTDWIHSMQFLSVTNGTLDGVTLVNQSTVHPAFITFWINANTVTINNVKFFGTRTNNDGINCEPCTQMTITNNFIRSEDDAIALYADQSFGTGKVDNSNIMASGNVFWTLISGPVRIGTCEHSFAPTASQVHGLTVTDSDILHMPAKQSNGEFSYLLDMEDGNAGGRCFGAETGSFDYENILFSNLRINQLDEFVNINLDSTTNGKVRNLSFKNITIATRPVRTTMFGLAPEGNQGWSYIGANDIDKISFQHIVVAGQVANSVEGIGADGLHGSIASTPSQVDISPIVNNSFDNDGAATPNPEGWSVWNGANGSGSGASYTEAGGHSGGWRLAQWKATAYQVATYQDVLGLTNGESYKFCAWVEGSGDGQTLSVNRYDGSGTALATTIPGTTNWAQICTPSFTPQNGQARVEFDSNTRGYAWIRADDVTLQGIENPGFEADGTAVGKTTPQPLGWNLWPGSNGSGSGASYTEMGGHTGNWRLAQWQVSSYQVATYQDVTGLVNGTSYSFCAWVEGSGDGQTMSVNRYDNNGSSQAATIPGTANWTQVCTPTFTPQNGQARVEFDANTRGNAWTRIDDVTLVQH